jgi:hypothetical protein
MKKIKVASLLLVVVLLTGCPTEQPMGTEGPKSPAVEKVSHQVEEIKLEDLEYFLPELQEELDPIDKMTTEEAAEVFTEHRKEGTLGQLGVAYYMQDLVNEGLIEELKDSPVLMREGAKAAVVSSKYDLPFSVVNPYTGRIYGELYADDLEYFAPVEDSMEAEILKNLKNDVNRATTIESIMGYEGNAARLYFKGLSLLADKDFKFRGRSRMPPRDPFNSLLSLGYTLLLYEAYTAIANKGLNPYAGFLHKDRQGHPTLASDLMEEWRAVLVDSLVMSMVNGRKVKKEDFYTKKETGAILIQKNALKKVIGEFENKIRTETSYLDYIDTRMSFRRAIQTQVGALCKTIDNNDVSIYRPIRLR